MLVLRSGCLAVALALLAAGPAGAQNVISLNFAGGGPNGCPCIVTGSAGVVPASNWNNFTGSSSGGVPQSLLDDTGVPTAGTAITWTSDNIWSTPGVFTDENALMMKGYLDNGILGRTSIIVTDVPYATYKVYVYFNDDNDTSGTIGAYTIGGGRTIDPTTAISTIYGNEGGVRFGATGPFTQAFGSTPTTTTVGNYLVFDNLSSPSFWLTAVPYLLRAPVNGIQIVSTTPQQVTFNSVMDYVKQLGNQGIITDPGTVNALVSVLFQASLKAGRGEIETKIAVHLLNAFIHFVNAQMGKAILPSVAQTLLADANALLHALSPGLAVLSLFERTVIVFDPVADTFEAGIRVEIPVAFPTAAIVTPDGLTGIVVDRIPGSGFITLIDLTTSPPHVKGTIPTTNTLCIGFPGIPAAIAVTPDSRFALVTLVCSPGVNGSGGVLSVDLQNQQLASATGAVANGAIAITPDGTRALVTGRGQVYNVDIDANGILTTGQILPVGSESSDLRSIAITPHGDLALVTDFSSDSTSPHGVRVLNILANGVLNHCATCTKTTTGVVDVGLGTSGIAITPDGRHAYVSTDRFNEPAKLAVLSIDGQNVRDTGTRITVNTETAVTFSGISGLGFIPDGSRLYVCDFGRSGCSIVNTATNEVVTSIFLVLNPVGIGMPH